jgi:hypothetical protein
MSRSRRIRMLGIDRMVATLLVLLPLLASCARTIAPARQFPRLADVRRVYVAPLGASSDAEGVRDAIRQRLGESGRFIVVDEASADAILGGIAGVGLVETMGPQLVDLDGRVTTSYDKHPAGIAQLRLLVAGSRDTIWRFDAPKKASDDKPVATVAEQVVRRLLTDAAAADSVRQAP